MGAVMPIEPRHPSEPPSHFSQSFPLMMDSALYAIYSILLIQALHILLSRQRASAKVSWHLPAMCALFLLSTLHITVAWTWAFTTDTATTAIYEVFSLTYPLPTLAAPDDPPRVHYFATFIKVRFAIANFIADTILMHRCYIIWNRRWKIMIIPAIAYIVNYVVTLLPLSQSTRRSIFASCMTITFLTNVLISALTAGRIWWMARKINRVLQGRTTTLYSNLIAILLESGSMYPAAILVGVGAWIPHQAPLAMLLSCFAVVYHTVAIAPTLVIVRIGLGISMNDVDEYIASVCVNSVCLSRRSGHPSLGTLHFAVPAASATNNNSGCAPDVSLSEPQLKTPNSTDHFQSGYDAEMGLCFASMTLALTFSSQDLQNCTLYEPRAGNIVRYILSSEYAPNAVPRVTHIRLGSGRISSACIDWERCRFVVDGVARVWRDGFSAGEHDWEALSGRRFALKWRNSDTELVAHPTSGDTSVVRFTVFRPRGMLFGEKSGTLSFPAAMKEESERVELLMVVLREVLRRHGTASGSANSGWRPMAAESVGLDGRVIRPGRVHSNLFSDDPPPPYSS
ncbi:Ras-GEF domain-containing protein [Mycena indigotica]|uniref:Ras-GEF domain-containing protein n=1 Tax=Mycena indigotica TaxID=2126181 RepID=A0A8H6TEX0_9AGAR|nr:Ras-GEF domain-containing protein [Mycena indigotica]KAF7315994.1 Ras-GEF domain-containing protein [Mycena indigotica]